MRSAPTVAAIAAIILACASTAAIAEPITDCAGIEGKALGNLLADLFKIAGKACGKGSAGHPLGIGDAATAAAAAKFYLAVGKANEKDGRSSCFVTLETLTQNGLGAEPADVVRGTETLAGQLCLVP